MAFLTLFMLLYHALSQTLTLTVSNDEVRTKQKADPQISFTLSFDNGTSSIVENVYIYLSLSSGNSLYTNKWNITATQGSSLFTTTGNVFIPCIGAYSLVANTSSGQSSTVQIQTTSNFYCFDFVFTANKSSQYLNESITFDASLKNICGDLFSGLKFVASDTMLSMSNPVSKTSSSGSESFNTFFLTAGTKKIFAVFGEYLSKTLDIEIKSYSLQIILSTAIVKII